MSVPRKERPELTLKDFEEIIGYPFKDKKLIENAMTHSSYANENKGAGVRSYERLEFLGDSILGFVTAEYLFRNRKNPEGELTKMRAGLVCEQNLALVAEKIGLGRYLILGKGEELSQGRNRPSILADVVEATIGALFIDGGITAAKAFIDRYILAVAVDVTPASTRDYKTELQEHVQKNRDDILSYQLVGEFGPDHDKTFEVEAVVNGESIGQGKGHSKKEAEQMAASDAMKRKGL